MKRHLKIMPLEERIVLDAAVAAVVADAVATVSSHEHHAATAVIYVDANASGSVHDGTSWAKAYTNLQDGLDKAVSTTGADQIWVAKGNYTPSKIYSPDGVTGGALGLTVANMKTFNIPDNVEIYGGFKSGMHNLSQRNPDKYVTVLNGDLAGNDINDSSNAGYAGSKADNAWHVTTLGNDVDHTGVHVKMDGLSIINGYANGPEGSPFFTPVLANNYNYGGGSYINFDSTVIINNVTYKYNHASGDGGGLFSNNSDVVVQDSTFLNNSAIARAGALEMWSTFETDSRTMVVKDSYFQDNTAVVFGGAIVGEGSFPSPSAKLFIENSTFVHNTAAEGGAIVVDSLNVFVNDSVFINNIAQVNGGAIAETNVVDTFIGGPINLTTTITDSRFIGNEARGDLGVAAFMSSLFSTPPSSVVNFAVGGGALVNYMHGNLVVDGSEFIGNRSINSDGGAILSGSGNVTSFGTPIIEGVHTTATNSVFKNNQAVGGNGGAIAATASSGYVALPGLEANVINISRNSFKDNLASNGGAIEINNATATILNNKFFKTDNALINGDQIYGAGSIINGVASSAANAAYNLVLHNKFQALDMDDLYLI